MKSVKHFNKDLLVSHFGIQPPIWFLVFRLKYAIGFYEDIRMNQRDEYLRDCLNPSVNLFPCEIRPRRTLGNHLWMYTFVYRRLD